MGEKPQITDAELEVMKVLWELQQASGTQVVEQLQKTTEWKPKTVLTLIKRLTDKQAVKAEKTGRRAYLYSPIVSAGEYRALANQSFLHKVYSGSLRLMLSSFVKDSELPLSEIEKLKKIIDDEV